MKSRYLPRSSRHPCLWHAVEHPTGMWRELVSCREILGAGQESWFGKFEKCHMPAFFGVRVRREARVVFCSLPQLLLYLVCTLCHVACVAHCMVCCAHSHKSQLPWSVHVTPFLFFPRTQYTHTFLEVSWYHRAHGVLQVPVLSTYFE